MRVLHVVPCMKQGGIENFVMNLYRAIDRDKIQFDFLITMEREGVFIEEAEKLGANVIYMGNISKQLIVVFFRLIRYLKCNKDIKVIHCHVWYFSGIILLAAKIAGVSIRIVHAHNVEVEKKSNGMRKLYELIMKKLIDNLSTYKVGCAKVAAVALFGEECIKDNNVKIIYNGIDTDKFNVRNYDKDIMKKEYNLECYKYNFVHVGRFEKVKNHEKVIEIFRDIDSRIENTHLTLVGDGSLKKYVEGLIEKYKLKDKVTIMSNRDDVQKILMCMDAVIFPSYHEAFSLALLEFQAMGLRCYISDTITRESDLGLCEFLDIKKEAGYWGKYITNTIQDKKEKISDYKIQKYSIQNVKNQVLTLYQ